GNRNPRTTGSSTGGNMHRRSGAQLGGRGGAQGALIAAIAAGACFLPASALAAPASAALAGAVSPTPASGTPVLSDTGTTEQVRQLVQCGGALFAGGALFQGKPGGRTHSPEQAFWLPPHPALALTTRSS